MFLALLLLGYAGAIDEPQAVVASFVSVGKCGSSTMRAMLAVEYHGYKVCGISNHHSQKMANKFRALGGDVTLLDQWEKGLQPESGCQILLAYDYVGAPGECGGGGQSDSVGTCFWFNRYSYYAKVFHALARTHSTSCIRVQLLLPGLQRRPVQKHTT